MAASNDPQVGFNPILWNSISSIWAKGNTLLSSDIIPYLRSRNIEFTAKRLKPLTRLYSYFDGRSVDKFIVPKLIQIQMISGTFQVGETVIGKSSSGAAIKFRVAKCNHKYGPYDSPSVVFTQNPYSSDTTIPSLYSSTSTILNVDTYSLSNIAQSGFSGYIESGMVLRGQLSGAQAKILSNVRLVADSSGDVIGSFFIPDRNIAQNPSFESGTRVFRLTNSANNSQVEGAASTFAEEKYFSTGRLYKVEENIVRIEPPVTPVQVSAPNSQTISESGAAQTETTRIWQDGDIVVHGSHITTSDEGQSLVNSINAKNGTSFTVGILMDTIGLQRINTMSELQRINAIARRLAEGNPSYWWK